MERDRLGALVLDVQVQVVLHVLADSRHVLHHRDANLLQVLGVADAGQH